MWNLIKWGKSFINFTYDRELGSRIYKDLIETEPQTIIPFKNGVQN